MIVIIHWFCNHCEAFSMVVFHYNSYTMLHLVCTYIWSLTPLLQHYGEIYNCLFFQVIVCIMCDVLILGQMFLSHTCVVTLLIISVVLHLELTVCTFGIIYLSMIVP